jgi:hypothetical protein
MMLESRAHAPLKSGTAAAFCDVSAAWLAPSAPAAKKAAIKAPAYDPIEMRNSVMLVSGLPSPIPRALLAQRLSKIPRN